MNNILNFRIFVSSNKMSMSECKPTQAGSLFLPPATNWFSSGSTDSREEDRLLVAGAFKSIVLYKIPVGPDAPTVLKYIHHSGAKVLHVKLFPDAGHQQHGSSLLASSDLGSVTLYNAETGVATLQHNEHGAGGIQGVCWCVSSSSDEVSAVSVGASGTLVVWNVGINVTRKLYVNPTQRSNVLPTPQPDVTLTLVEPLPGADNTVIVAAQKVFFILDIKSGRVLSHLRGHDQPIYCLRWWTPSHPAATTPFSDARPLNARAQALRDDCSGAEADSKDPEGAPSGRYFASSDLGGNVLLWDVDRRRYVYRTKITSSLKGGGGRGYRPSSQHCALAWHGNNLLTNTVAGAIISLPLSENSAASCVSVNHDTATASYETAPQLQKSNGGSRSDSNSWRTSNKDPEKKSAENDNNGSELKPKVVHREHYRVVFNLNVVGSTLVSCSHDRNLIGYALDINKVQFCLPTLGSAVHSIAFDPRDSSWLALGLQEDSIRLVKLNSSPPLRSKIISNGIRGKVLALSWHPNEDGFLLYGTSEGQVGIANANTAKVTAFSFFHQKSVYKVEWAPAVLANVHPDYAKSFCAYSFGDREIAMRNPNVPMADPVKLSKLVNFPGHVSEFSFSRDFKYFAVGCQDGSISVYRSSDLAALVKIVVVRKTIQHLLWKPVPPSENSEQKTPYILVIASSESRICLLDLTNTLPEQSDKFDLLETKQNDGSLSAESTDVDLPSRQPLIVSTCTRELCGHSNRVVYLSFSACDPHLLASASYDHTCQVWDSNSGEQLGNYRSHLSRLYRVEFSPSEPGLLFSFGEENCIHHWKFTDLKDKSPPEKALKFKEAKPKIATDGESVDTRDATPPKASSKNLTKLKNAKHNETSAAVTTSRRAPTLKSFFPLLHQVSCHKRSFNLMSIMCLNEQSKLEQQKCKEAEELSVEEMLEAAEEGGGGASSLPPVVLGSASAHYSAAVDAVGDAVFDADDPPPPQDDLKTFVDFHGAPDQTAEFLDQQIASHMDAGNVAAAAPLQLWRGTSEAVVRHAITTKTVTADVVVQAMHVSRQLGEVACEAYAHQLAAAGDPHTASSYLVMANKVTEAIELLQLHKLYREALVLAKTRRPYSKELHRNIARSFASSAMHEGNLDVAALLLASVGDATEAAAMLCRRGDPASLTVGGLLYWGRDNDLALVTLMEALRTAGYKGQLDKVLPSVLKVAPQYKWFSLIAATVREMTALMAAVKARSSEGAKSRSSSPESKPFSSGNTAPSAPNTDHGDVGAQENVPNTRTSPENEASCATEQDQEICHNASSDTAVNGILPRADFDGRSDAVQEEENKIFLVYSEEGEEKDVLQRVVALWPRDVRPSDVHTAICAALPAALKPSSLKQYVFLLCVELTKLLLCVSGSTQTDEAKASDAAATALHSALQLTLDWNRFEQLFEVTHILLPRGVKDPPEMLTPLFKAGAPAATLLCKLHSLTELAELHQRCSGNSLAENASKNIPDTVGDNSTEVEPILPDASAAVQAESCELNKVSCRGDVEALIREVAEGFGAGDETKVKRIFENISSIFYNLNIM